MPEWRIQELAPGVFARTGVHPLQPNSGVVIGDEGVLVVDSGFSTSAGRELLEDVRRLTDKPVTTVVISHHHFDHAWGNEAFAGAALIGHANARGNMLGDQSDYQRRMVEYAPTSAGWYGMEAGRLARELAETRIIPPEGSFDGRMTLDFAGPRVELLHFGAAHTNGDAIVLLPDAGVLFGGDLVCNRVFPNALDGDPLHWPRVLDAIGRLDVDLVVPGHGPAGGRDLLGGFDACLAALTAEVQRTLDDGAPDPRSASERLRLNDWGDWAGRELLPGTVRKLYRALEGPRG